MSGMTAKELARKLEPALEGDKVVAVELPSGERVELQSVTYSNLITAGKSQGMTIILQTQEGKPWSWES